MADKDNQGSKNIENPFTQNQECPPALPPLHEKKRKRSITSNHGFENNDYKLLNETGKKFPRAGDTPGLTATESGGENDENHLELFFALASATRPQAESIPTPRISFSDWVALFQRNRHNHGRHFVVHQHDHPVAGPHYDLRLQYSRKSSLSFAIMYGFPGDPNSRRLNRNAVETQVHNLWYHVVETASATIGSTIIWDTGEYSILPYYDAEGTQTDHSLPDASASTMDTGISESDKLRQAFQKGKIRLRLHGTRLPQDYTVSLRLIKSNYTFSQLKNSSRKRQGRRVRKHPTSTSTSRPSSESSSPVPQTDASAKTQDDRNPTPPIISATHSDDGDEYALKANGHSGATDITSTHHGRWYLSLDRVKSGFECHTDPSTRRRTWRRRKVINQEDGSERVLGFDPFLVRGPKAERSVVTGRLGRDVLEDEMIEGFKRRSGWRPVLG